VNHEKIPVRLVGSGLDKDYEHDGISHQPSRNELAILFNGMFKNMDKYVPEDKTEVPSMVEKMVMRNQPSFICLRR
jgi:transketolase C-terminal domain/subunit